MRNVDKGLSSIEKEATGRAIRFSDGEAERSKRVILLHSTTVLHHMRTEIERE